MRGQGGIDRVGRAREAGNVGAVFAAQRLARDQRFDHAVEAEKERLAQRKTCRHVFAFNRKQIAELQLVRVLFCELVEPCRIGIEQRAGVFGQVRIVALCRAARVEQVVDIIDCRAVLAGDRAIAAPGHGDHVLQGREIVFRMGDGDAVSDVRVGIAIDMRHAEFVANDLCGVGALRLDDIVALCPQRFPGCQRDECDKHEQQKGETDAPEPFGHEIQSSLATDLASCDERCNRSGQNLSRPIPLWGFGCLAMCV